MSGEKFVTPGVIPSGYDAELLVCLMEECAEVQQRAAKMLRFGVEETQPGQEVPHNNMERLSHEVGDLFEVLRRMELRGMVNAMQVYSSAMNKRQRLDKYLQSVEAPATHKATDCFAPWRQIQIY